MRKSMLLGYSLASTRIAVSLGVQKDISSLSGLPASRFQVIYNPAARGSGERSTSRPAELDGSSGPLILAVGSLKQQKRHDLLLQAFAALPEGGGFRLCILGEGPMRANL